MNTFIVTNTEMLHILMRGTVNECVRICNVHPLRNPLGIDAPRIAIVPEKVLMGYQTDPLDVNEDLMRYCKLINI